MDDKDKKDILAILDDFANAVEIFTGFKNQFINAGWSEENAELLVVHVLKVSLNDAAK